MNLTRLYAIIKKEIRHILRDPRSLITAIVLPICLMFAYCSSLSLDVDNLPMVVIDYDKTTESRDLINRFTSSGYFYVTEYAENYRQMQHSIDTDQSVIGITIPRDFSKKLKAGGSNIPVQIMVDGTDPNRGGIGSNYASMITQKFALDTLKTKMTALGMVSPSEGVETQLRIWYNPSLRSTNDLIPGLIALIMAVLAAMLTSTTVAKEWENGTMELLISTPVSAAEIITGKFIPYFIIGLFDTVLLILLGYYAYNVPIKGSLLLLAIVIVVFLSGVLMLGITISTILRSSLASNLVSMMLMFLPTMLLSGFIFFIPAMPEFLQAVSTIVPAKYFIECSRGIYAKATGFNFLAFNIFMLLLFNIVIFAAAKFKFKKTLD